MCEACSFCLSVRSEDKSLLAELAHGINARCPINLFSQVLFRFSMLCSRIRSEEGSKRGQPRRHRVSGKLGTDAFMKQTGGSEEKYMNRDDAFKFLLHHEWNTMDIAAVLDHLDVNRNGKIDREQLTRTYEAVLSVHPEQWGPDATTPINLHCDRYALQFRASIVLSRDVPFPSCWHEQACRHLSIKGYVRICPKGLLLDLGICIEGRYSDIQIYVDSFLASSNSGAANGEALLMRQRTADESCMRDLRVIQHSSSSELYESHHVRQQTTFFPLTLLI